MFSLYLIPFFKNDSFRLKEPKEATEVVSNATFNIQRLKPKKSYLNCMMPVFDWKFTMKIVT